ncbi:cation:proton antiporter [candidate division MSBL1 archaeon SCGC-AAA259A05]|uniref:Cation:proton antiporter n=1 Tax=candidate division MSBL1 archaeon SCGC-AAA259A05 TaxID=1698259 RepID=A0A133U3Z4_9EURY|nr:cation:proton antiporter [candidate division MSBL1 archaeon SCGC-AAA259A05]
MILVSAIVSVVLFLAGASILIYSVEELIENISKAAIMTGVSSFFLAVVFVGMDFENWGFGIASVVRGLPGIAIGSAFGSAVFLVGVAVAVGGFVTPFERKVNGDYLFLMLISPFLLLLFLWDGSLSRADGIILLALFAGIIYYLYREERKGRETFRDEEAEEAAEEIEEDEHGKWYFLGLSGLFVIGIVVGSEMAVHGAEDIVSLFGLEETVFGMTFVGLVMALEEVLLVVEPVRKGRENIATGNIIGSLIFFATGNIGLIASTRGFSVAPSVLSFYWPFLFASTSLTAIFLYGGKINRGEASILGTLYLLYWILSYTIV